MAKPPALPAVLLPAALPDWEGEGEEPPAVDTARGGTCAGRPDRFSTSCAADITSEDMCNCGDSQSDDGQAVERVSDGGTASTARK